jgi:hypothetical protein
MTPTKSGSELIIDGIVRGLETIKRSSGYATSPEVSRGFVNYSAVSGSEKEELFVEIAPEEPETREGEWAGPIISASLPVQIVAVLLDEKDTSERLNAFVKDVIRCLGSRAWDLPTWNGGRGCATGMKVVEVRRWVAAGSSTKAATITVEVQYYEPMDPEA